MVDVLVQWFAGRGFGYVVAVAAAVAAAAPRRPSRVAVAFAPVLRTRPPGLGWALGWYRRTEVQERVSLVC